MRKKKEDKPAPIEPTRKEKREAARQGRESTQAFCTECGQWYSTENEGQVNLHAH